jgi:hypothetical protein
MEQTHQSTLYWWKKYVEKSSKCQHKKAKGAQHEKTERSSSNVYRVAQQIDFKETAKMICK